MRARFKPMSRKEQALFIRGEIGKMPVEERTLQNVMELLKQHKIKLGEGSIYSHIKVVNRANGNGHAEGNGHVVDLETRFNAVARASKQCGGLAALKEAVTLVEKAKAL